MAKNDRKVKLHDQEVVAVSSLKTHPKNYRKHGPEQLQHLVESLKANGVYRNVVVAKDYTILAGHGVIEACKLAGVATIPVVRLDVAPSHPSAMKVLAGDNEIQRGAEVDDHLLADILKEIAGIGAEALIGTGFDLGSLEDLVESIEPRPEIVEDQAPEPPKKPVSKLGDLWLLGDHRILCGDSTKGEDVTRLMDGKRAVLMATDPPYGIAYTDETRVAAERAHGRPLRMPKWEEGLQNDEKTGEDIQPFLEAAFHAAVSNALAPNAAWYLWHAHLTQGFFAAAAAAAAAAKLVLSRQIIWVKPSLLFGFGDYHWRHELCFYGWVKGKKPPFYGARNQTTIWEITHEVSNGNREHQTQKPVEIFAIPIRNHTRKGEIVYEPFSGSGTQIVAAEQLGRRCYAIEIAPAYVDVAVLRWQKLTEKKAVHGKTGAEFKD